MSAVPGVSIQQLGAAAARAELEALCALLVDSVAGGASVGFLAPLSDAKARAFWGKVIASVESGECLLLVARNEAGRIDGTVQVVLMQKENQPHRAEVSKLLVHRRARRHGLGAVLMQAAESAARGANRSLLVLDTSTPEAERLYERLGWQTCGRIPDYALLPDGTPGGVTIYYKAISPTA
jgi:ribosomal protein S18 acetylase RimI-like enzyme